MKQQHCVMSLPRSVLDSSATSQLFHLMSHKELEGSKSPQLSAISSTERALSKVQVTPSPDSSPTGKYDRQLIQYRKKLEKERKCLLKKIRDSD